MNSDLERFLTALVLIQWNQIILKPDLAGINFSEPFLTGEAVDKLIGSDYQWESF